MTSGEIAIKWAFRTAVVSLFAWPPSACAQVGGPDDSAAALRPVYLRCEYRVAPLGIDVRKPRLSWLLEAHDVDQRGLTQTAYQIAVSSDRTKLASDNGDLWDSGKVASDQISHVEYFGKPLTSGVDCWWKVRVWDNNGRASSWSEPARWSMGLFEPDDWSAQWIGFTHMSEGSLADCQWVWHREGAAYPNPHQIAPGGTRFFRKQFNIPAQKQVTEAAFCGACDNSFTLHVNGKQLGTGEEWSQPMEIEVAGALVSGTNTLALRAANFAPSPAALAGRLRVTYSDNTSQTLYVDGSWKSTGEEVADWTKPEFDDQNWSAAQVLGDMGMVPWGVLAAGVEAKLPPATYWRKVLKLKKPISRAIVYVSALGAYELSVNGERVGQDYFNPGWPDLRKRVYYHTYDVTSMLRPGDNCLAGILSTGWYAGYIWAGPFHYGKTPQLLVQLEIEYDGGTTQTIATDESWKCSYGPLLEADTQQGETYDARLEMPNWNLVDFDDATWKVPDLVIDANAESGDCGGQLYERELEASPNVTVKVQQEIKPVKMSEPKPGVTIFDLGQNISGWARIGTKGPAGTKIVLRFSGMLNPDGTLYTEYLREARAIDTYILRGSGEEEVWEPKFTYHGFQYVEITGYTEPPTLDMVTGVVCHSEVPMTGSFACSDERVNKLYSNCIWTLKGNLVDIPTGCGDRAERLGWMGLGQMVYSWCYSFDMDAFLTKWMVDIVDAQSAGASGAYLQCSPFWGDVESPGWSDDGVCVPFALHRFYGDTRIIEENYESLSTYMGHIERSLTDHLRTGNVYHSSPDANFNGYGDWVAIVENRELHNDVLNTLWNGWSVSNMAEMAEAIGKRKDALQYQQLLANMKQAFDEAYVAADGKVRDDTQAEYALGLYFEFFPEEKVSLAVDHLVDDIVNKSHTQMRQDALQQNPVIPPGHLTTGFHGTRALLPMLSKYGRNDVAYRLLLEDTYPSWLYCVKNGATSVYERWDSWMPKKGFQDPRMNSFHMPHLMASVVEWLMADVGGIKTQGPGFKQILIQPHLGEGLSWAEASYQSINGKIAVSWRKIEDGSLTMKVTIPPNTTATISVPKSGVDSMSIQESGSLVWSEGRFLDNVAAISGAAENSDHVTFQTESGTYDFKVTEVTE